MPKAAPGSAADSGEVVEAVNFNDPKQTVIAGSKAGVDKACEVLKAHGRQARAAAAGLGAVPFEPDEAGGRGLRERLADVAVRGAAASRVVNNVDVAVETDSGRIRDALYRQAFGPVRWVEVVQALRARGLTPCVECGPGKVLAGMVKRIDADAGAARCSTRPSLAEAKGLLA